MPRHNSFSTLSSSSLQQERRPEEEAAAAASDEYFVQQAKLYRHLEKRLNKFNKKAANARHRPNRNRKLSKSVKPTFSTPSNASTSPPISSSTSSDTFTSTMISSSIRVSGRSLTQVIVSVKWLLICTKINPNSALLSLLLRSRPQLLLERVLKRSKARRRSLIRTPCLLLKQLEFSVYV